MRVFFDTNVLVSAFLARGLCADLLRLVLSEHTLLCSEVVLDDEWVLASAVLVEADLFLTGDQGVLSCSRSPLPLLNPRSCWEHLPSFG